MIRSVLDAYGIKEAQTQIFGNGLIHRTWKVLTPGGNFILQKVHDGVFKRPKDIANNTRLIADYLQKNYPEYLFVTPVISCMGEDMIWLKDEGYFRVFPFVEGSHSSDTVETASQAYEAA